MAKPVHNPNHPFFFFLFLFIFLLSIADSEQLQPSQSQALLKIQQQLNYPQVLSGWNETTDFCNIDPNPSLTLVCYEDNITQLHINGETRVNPSFSSVSFFSNLVALPTLKVLSLVSIGLWGPLPPSIEGLSSLEILNLSSNGFSGSIPQEISSLRSLQTLILDHNRFTGQVPTWVSSLPLLTVLSFNNNSLTGYLPNSMTSFESLRILSLSMNQLTGEVPNLQNLRNLQVLDLGDNEFGPHFPSLPTKLLIIVLRKNRFRFGIPEELSTSYYQLQKLDVSLNGFGGPFLLPLLSLPSLSYLDISGNKFTGMLSGNTSCNGELGYVNLSLNRLAGELPTCLQPIRVKARNKFYLRDMQAKQRNKNNSSRRRNAPTFRLPRLWGKSSNMCKAEWKTPTIVKQHRRYWA